MIQANELRLGNYILYKAQHKISRIACNFDHFQQIAMGNVALFFPVVLKPEVLEQCGFIENKDYPLAPQAREYRLELPVPCAQQVQVAAYIKSNGESFARAVMSNLPVSGNI